MLTQKLHMIKGKKHSIRLIIEAHQAEQAQEDFGQFGDVTLARSKDGCFSLILEYEFYTSLQNIKPFVEKYKPKKP